MPAPYIICKWHRGMRLLKITSREAFSPPYMTSAREARSSRPFTFSRNASSCVHSEISRQRRRGTNRQKKMNGVCMVPGCGGGLSCMDARASRCDAAMNTLIEDAGNTFDEATCTQDAALLQVSPFCEKNADR